jgi:hypothetical protein
MTIAKTIAFARKFGVNAAYARVMSGAIRAAMSARAASQLRAAIVEDKAEHLFRDLNTSCPTAA